MIRNVFAPSSLREICADKLTITDSRELTEDANLHIVGVDAVRVDLLLQVLFIRDV